MLVEGTLSPPYCDNAKGVCGPQIKNGFRTLKNNSEITIKKKIEISLFE